MKNFKLQFYLLDLEAKFIADFTGIWKGAWRKKQNKNNL